MNPPESIKMQQQKSFVPVVRGKWAFEPHTSSQIFPTLSMNTGFLRVSTDNHKSFLRKKICKCLSLTIFSKVYQKRLQRSKNILWKCLHKRLKQKAELEAQPKRKAGLKGWSFVTLCEKRKKKTENIWGKFQQSNNNWRIEGCTAKVSLTTQVCKLSLLF